MSTPIFDSISVNFAKLIADSVATAATNGTKLSATNRNAIVNQAMGKLFTDVIKANQGDKRLIVNQFPELLSAPIALTLTAGNYNIQTGAQDIKDIWKLWQSYISSGPVYIRVLDEAQYTLLKTSENNLIVASASNPAVFQISNQLLFFPESSTFTPSVIYIKQPLDPTTGLPLTQGGSYDCPFGYNWIQTISEIAKQIFLDISQER